jgi:cell division protein ZapA
LASVNVTIDGRQFRMACEDGQEEHLAALAADFDARITDMRSKFGEVGDQRLTIMAALTIADQLAETVNKLRQVEAELPALRAAQVLANDRAQATQAAVVAAFNAAAERLERVAKRLNQSVSGPGPAQG